MVGSFHERILRQSRDVKFLTCAAISSAESIIGLSLQIRHCYFPEKKTILRQHSGRFNADLSGLGPVDTVVQAKISGKED